MSKNLPRVAIIGAGSSGIIAAKELKDRGIDFDCFEKGSRVGGNWVYKNDNGMSAAYSSLHINTSRQQMEFKCFPMSDDFPDFPHHSMIADYFDRFVNHFDLKKHIRFHCEVKKVEPMPSGKWQVTLATGETSVFDAVIVANGHHWDPRWPDPAFPGTFDGVEMHSHAYLNPAEPENLYGKNVVILGMGNSAMDIACELGNRGVAKKVFLAARSGMHIMPKYFGSRPADSYFRHPGDAPSWWEYLVPYRLLEHLAFFLLQLRIRLSVGLPQDYGLPKPRHRFGASHPTISNEVHIRLGSGDVIPKPNIRELSGKKVMFTDGSAEDVDAIIYATGYKISFPFLAGKVLPFANNDIPLFKRIFTPKCPNLMFIGLVQPLCSIVPIAEQQARLIGDYLVGDYALPDVSEMTKTMTREHKNMKKRYVSSERHTIQINCLEYTFGLYREIKKGRKRAANMRRAIKASTHSLASVART